MTNEQPYLGLLREALDHGTPKGDRTGTGTYSLFGRQMRFDLADGFPVVTTKKLHLRSVIHELLWFLRGDTNLAYLHDNKVRIWDEWADANGDLGPIYGAQWRSWPTPSGETIDQMAAVVDAIRTNPDSRRLIVTAWNPGQIDEMALPPCHLLFQFYSYSLGLNERLRRAVAAGHDLRPIGGDLRDGRFEAVNEKLGAAGVPERALDCQLYQRSGDLFLGVPFNIASYALLTHMVATVTNHLPGTFVHTLGDAHLYQNHVEQARTQLDREPLPPPSLHLNPAVDDLFAFTFEDITIVGYESHPAIKAPVAV